MIEDYITTPQHYYLNSNASKITWLAETNLTQSNLFCVGYGENQRKFSLWKMDRNMNRFEPNLIHEQTNLDGDLTDLQPKNVEEFFVSTSNGSIYYYKYLANEQKVVQMHKWQVANEKKSNGFLINAFDYDAGFNELCAVGEDGTINFIRYDQQTTETRYSANAKESCSLNKVLYLKQDEIAVADSLGRVKLWDTRLRDKLNSTLTFAIEGECSPILCMNNHPNQQHIVACGNLNGLIFIYDVRGSNKKPFIMCQNNSEPVTEICFHPFSSDNLISSSFDGSLWFWNSTNKDASSKWDCDHNMDLKNLLPNNSYTLNSFDINNDHILAVNNNLGLFKIKNQHFM